MRAMGWTCGEASPMSLKGSRLGGLRLMPNRCSGHRTGQNPWRSLALCWTPGRCIATGPGWRYRNISSILDSWSWCRRA
eukprot:11408478-Karenia_brevis.AAC.1